MKKFLLVFLSAFAVIACGQVRKTAGGLEVRGDGGSAVRLEAVSDGIIRVMASPDGNFVDRQSLCVLPRSAKVPFCVSEDSLSAVLSTDRLTAVVDKATLAVTFLDRDGQVLAGEDGRDFSPIEVDGCKGWSVRQTFKAVDGEGFYGLGQHQADEWNYKGRNEELYQYNTKISVPFVVSSRGYGLLWDSYSFCRWGDPRGYAQLPEVFTLYDKAGEAGALTGTYTPAQGKPLVRRETALDQEFLRTPQCDVVTGAPEGFNFAGSRVLFEGSLEAPESGTYRFYLYYAGYTKVFLDGKQVMPEIWRTAWNPNARKFEARLCAGKKTPVRIEWIPDGGVSYCGLRALSPVAPEEQAKMSWWGEMQDQIDYYFIEGADADAVISGYRTLTGTAPLIPKWALGYWQSRERYRTQEEVVGTLREFRRRGIPVDNIVQDWQYWEDEEWGSHEFDLTRYPDPKAMVDSIHAMNGRFMISVWPKFYKGTEHFDEMDSRGWIYRTAIDEKVIDWLGYEQSFYDAYDPGARALFWQQMKDHLYPIGVDSWWMDASEPNIHDCTDMDYRKKMCGPTALGPSTKYFNAYALMNAQAIYEGQRASDDRRVFLLTRNGFAGLQRYSTASWSGDIGTRWEDMKAQVSAGLNYSISGLPWWGQDIGGFSVEDRFVKAQQTFDASGKVTPDLEEWREMNLRWHQWGVLCPLYRAHGQWPLREPWNIAPEGSEIYNLIVCQDKWRYAAMPYIYSLASRVHFEDYTMMRPLVMDFASDEKCLDIGDEFMFGDAILVCPVCEYKARSREVYLPQGCRWFDPHSGQFLEGGQTLTAAAPLAYIPLYMREGTMMVEGAPVQSTAEEQDELFVSIYGQKTDASFTIYEDDALSYAYERGEFSRIPLHYSAQERRFDILGAEGSFPSMRATKILHVTLIGDDFTRETKTIEYDGNAQTLSF